MTENVQFLNLQIINRQLLYQPSYRICLKVGLFAIVMMISGIHIQCQRLGLDILGNKSKVEIPFEYKHGFILLDVTFNRLLPLIFILDTGAEHTILFDRTIADVMQLSCSHDVRIMGADLQEQVIAFISRDVTFQLKKQRKVLRDIVILDKNNLNIEEVMGLRIDGIIGGSFFKGLQIRINYNKKILTLYHPSKKIKDLKDFEKIPVTIKQSKPYITSKLKTIEGKSVSTKLLLDTGAALTILLHANTSEDIELPDAVIPGSLGRGLGGDVEGFMGKVHEIRVGPFRFNNIISSFQDIDSSIIAESQVYRNGLIGNSILSRFEIVVDYMRELVYMKPYKNYNKDFGYDRSGLVIYAYGVDHKEFFIKTVYEGSPAYEAGLQEGDIITKIGWTSAKRYTLERLSRKLQQKEGKCVKFKILRNGEERKISFHLRDWFQQNPSKIP